MKIKFIFVLLSLFMIQETEPFFSFGYGTEEGPYFSAGFGRQYYVFNEPFYYRRPSYYYNYAPINKPYYKPLYNNVLMYDYDYPDFKDDYYFVDDYDDYDYWY